jgi:hypothetical protein
MELKNVRTAQIFKDEQWVDIKPIDIKAGDRFRMFEPNGTPVIGPHGTTSWIASKDAFVNDIGIVQVNNVGIKFKGEEL